MIKYSTIILSLLIFVSAACNISKTENGDSNRANSNQSSEKTKTAGNGSSASGAGNSTKDKNSESYAPPVFNGTTKKTTKSNNLESPAVLADVRTGKHKNFDRVVFEFKGEDMPGYYIEYIGEPITQCGSGNKIDLTGDGGLEIRFSPAQAHTDAGQPTLFFSDNEQNPNYPNMKKLKSTCDFEGNVTWVVGVSKANKYRVIALENPTRLAIDVEH